MADNKSDRGARDRATVSGDETYEVDYFARKHDISRDDAQALIDRVGNSRAALEAAVAEAGKKTSTTGTAKRGRKPAAAGGKSTSASGKVSKRLAPIKTAIEGVADAVVEPATEAVAPVARRVVSTGRSVGTAARRATATARTAAANSPKAAGKLAGETLETAKAAITGRAASLIGAAAAGLVTGLAVNVGRKIAVQAPSALAGDWFEALKGEHRLALGLFDALQATRDEDAGKRSALLAQLKHALAKHAFTEENVVYPALRAWGDKADADKLNHDHGYVKQYLYDLENMETASPAFLEQVAAFRADLEAHIREEEDAIFPPLHAALGATGNARVTAQANKEGFKLA